LSYAAIVFILLRQDLSLKPSRPYVGMLYSVELRSHFLKSEGKDINLSDTEQL